MEKLLDVRYLRRKMFSVSRSSCDRQDCYPVLQIKHPNSPSYICTHHSLLSPLMREMLERIQFLEKHLHSDLCTLSYIQDSMSICFCVVFHFYFLRYSFLPKNNLYNFPLLPKWLIFLTIKMNRPTPFLDMIFKTILFISEIRESHAC